jgi:methionyl-tRNA synthetase
VAEKAGRFTGGGALPVSEASRQAAARMVERFAGGYDPRRFSLTAAAFTLTEQLARLDRWEVTAADAGDFCHQVDVFLRCAAPLLVDLAGKALPDLAIPLKGTAGAAVEQVVPRVLPRLTGTVR